MEGRREFDLEAELVIAAMGTADRWGTETEAEEAETNPTLMDPTSQPIRRIGDVAAGLSDGDGDGNRVGVRKPFTELISENSLSSSASNSIRNFNQGGSLSVSHLLRSRDPLTSSLETTNRLCFPLS
jgi:hypothetical protein